VAVDGESWVQTDALGARFQRFPTRKAHDVLRIVTLGESSTFGSNYIVEETWAERLEERLQLVRRDRRVEVINAGVTGAVSDDILRVGLEVLAFQPDLLILYFGANDLGRMPRLASLQAYSPRRMELRARLDRFRVVGLLRRLLPEAALEAAEGAGHTGAFVDPGGITEAELVRVAELGVRQARFNMVYLGRQALRSGAEVLVVIQAQNQAKCPETATPSAEADCWPTALRRIAEGAAGALGVPLVDAPAALRAHSRAGKGELGDYFWDIIHPTALGHDVLAAAIEPAALLLLEQR
jgi:lysophospholipase L1-like esterase